MRASACAGCWGATYWPTSRRCGSRPATPCIRWACACRSTVFLAADGTVLAVHHVVRRNRWRAHWRARAVLELAAGRAGALALQRGQVLEFEEAA
nr:DUF192 domain-containing protein [Cupriavidus basilensis]